MIYNVTNSWSINDHRFPSSLSLLHHLKSHFPKLIILQIPHTGVLPMNCKKFYAYFIKKITLSFHAFPVLIARVYYTRNLQNGLSEIMTYPLQTYFQINLTTNPRNPDNLAICDGCKSNPNN